MTRVVALVLALGSPNGLPLKPVDWSAAYVRHWDGKKPIDTPLLEAIRKLRMGQGILFVLPESDDPLSKSTRIPCRHQIPGFTLDYNLGQPPHI